MITRLLIALAVALLAACSNEPVRTGDPMSQSSAVSVSMPGFVTDADTTLRWRSDLIWVDDPEGRFERRGQALQQALQNEFEGKGYRFLGAEEAADYDVLAVAMLGDVSGNQEVQALFRLYPSLASSGGDYQRGTVLVAIAPAGTRDIVWRGALQVYTDPGMTPLAQREERIRWGAANLLSSIPSHN